jgi:hypothetical protein
MKPLGSHATAERTNSRQEHVYEAMKMSGFAGLGNRQEEKCKGVLGREPTCKGERSSEPQAWGGGRGNSVISQQIVLPLTETHTLSIL